MHPIVNSLLDTDFYKFLMLQIIWNLHKNINTKFMVINRTKNFNLENEININDLKEQLNHARSLRFSEKEIIWLSKKKLYGKKNLFKKDFINWLKKFQLPEYELSKNNGKYKLYFYGPWVYTTMWEIPSLSIISELHSRKLIKNLDGDLYNILYSCAKEKVLRKIKRLKKFPNIKIGDFGTRHRHSFLWQQWCIKTLNKEIGNSFIGTSNVFFAKEMELSPIGTNAHELPMVYAALSNNNDDLKNSPYRVMQEWSRYYRKKFLIVLPDTFGTKTFLHNAPKWVSKWTGFRPDSAPPIESGELIIQWWKNNGQNPNTKVLIFSDSLNLEKIEKIYKYFYGRVCINFGWGTDLTNDFQNCNPKKNFTNKMSSLVCKVTEVNGRPAVKLSDNVNKEIGESSTIKYYKGIFSIKNI